MNIKKTSLFIITLILSVVLAACGDNNNTENNVNENGNSDSNNDAGTALVEDTRIDAENPSASPALAVDRGDTVVVGLQEPGGIFTPYLDRKSTRLNSSHVAISYAVFCLKKK